MEKNRPRTPDHQQSSCKCRRTPTPPSRACTPPPGPPVTPNLSTRQPQMFGAWTSMGPGGGGAPGDAAASGRPTAPGFMQVGVWRIGITVVPVAGRA